MLPVCSGHAQLEEPRLQQGRSKKQKTHAADALSQPSSSTPRGSPKVEPDNAGFSTPGLAAAAALPSLAAAAEVQIKAESDGQPRKLSKKQRKKLGIETPSTPHPDAGPTKVEPAAEGGGSGLSKHALSAVAPKSELSGLSKKQRKKLGINTPNPTLPAGRLSESGVSVKVEAATVQQEPANQSRLGQASSVAVNGSAVKEEGGSEKRKKKEGHAGLSDMRTDTPPPNGHARLQEVSALSSGKKHKKSSRKESSAP